MAETKADLEARVRELEADNERLRAQLAAAGRPAGVATPAHTFQLSEGDRQELAIRGVVNIGGELLTADQVRERLGKDQKRVEIPEPAAPVDQATLAAVRERSAVRGVDYVYPSVAPGKIDPAVAGTPGINGPAAE